MRARSVAAAQTIPRRGDVVANVEQHVRLARVAAGEQAPLVVFPELSLTGYELDLAGELAFSPSDPRLEPLVEVASSLAMTLVVGAPVRIESRLHIGAFIVLPDGRVDVYTKHHLGAFSDSARCDGVVPPAEATFFHPGDRNPLVELGGHTAAVAVCADTGRPSHPLQAAARGARTYLASMFIIPSEFTRESTGLSGYARQHSIAVVLANYGGPSGGLASAGRSAIWSETGDLLAQLDPTGAGVAVAVEGDGGWMARTIMIGGC
ncbi:MAG TPA: carbon-nitrogen hydrolase family protein [Vicinamibacteria bacterium]|nr:carbon-nitrogen hydrolase family protein [Vicinamibacteria bacterium]